MPSIEPNSGLAIGSTSPTEQDVCLVHVAVAVIVRERHLNCREFLIAKRADNAHQGGLWEFPGGKVEAGESVLQALDRELQEELGIHLSQQQKVCSPLIQIRHDYGDKQVLLDVWEVPRFEGEPFGREGQRVRWVAEGELFAYAFPEANKPILNACRIARDYAITPEYNSLADALSGVEAIARNGASMILLRQPQLQTSAYVEWAKALLLSCRALEGLGKPPRIMLHGDVANVSELSPDGVHLPFYMAEKLSKRPVSRSMLLAISCHSGAEVRHAEALGADFITLSPVLETRSHPGASTLGWHDFKRIVMSAKLPVFALGGMNLGFQREAQENGAQGIAGIRCWQ